MQLNSNSHTYLSLNRSSPESLELPESPESTETTESTESTHATEADPDKDLSDLCIPATGRTLKAYLLAHIGFKSQIKGQFLCPSCTFFATLYLLLYFFICCCGSSLKSLHVTLLSRFQLQGSRAKGYRPWVFDQWDRPCYWCCRWQGGSAFRAITWGFTVALKVKSTTGRY